MSKKIHKIKSTEAESILSSEVLPFETLIFFDNRNLINFFNEEVSFLGKAFRKEFTIAYDYKIKQNGKIRALSIMHPMTQLSFVELYRKYYNQILYHTSISKHSLRKPIAISKTYYTPKMIQKIKRIDDENLEGYENTSFFRYGPMRLAHKIYDSEFLLEMETSYKYMKKMDISKCFYNIYTHSIVWAIHDKNYAKNNTGINDLFGNFFDKKMQNSNHNETNGILVGPEVSRIFAEIILQKFDVNLALNIESNCSLKIGSDIDFYRYMDDILVFSNKIENLDLIKDIISDELSFFKLHLNNSKESLIERPFCTNLSSLKVKISEFINNFVKDNFQKSNLEKLIDNIDYALNKDRFDFELFKKSIKTSKRNKIIDKDFNFSVKKIDKLYVKFISDIRALCSLYEMKVEEISYYILKILDKKIFEILRSVRYSDNDKFNIFNIFVRIYFYLFKINPEYKNFLCIARFLLFSIDCFSENFKRDVKKIFSIQIGNFLKDYNGDDVVYCNLVILTSWMGKKYEINEDYLKNILNKNDYFCVITGINYCRNIKARNSLKIKFLENALNIIEKYENPLLSSEALMLCCDIYNCNYLDKMDKNIIIELFCNKSILHVNKGMPIYLNPETFKNKSKGLNFFQWNTGKIADLKKIVLSKQLLNVY
ncbi:RNA-directed DNA polymerase [Acinetobacter baumannii]|nr:RNA-directed DNA polymerase [Acinetobacter baumannii]